MLKKTGILVIILLVCYAGVFSQESNVQRDADRILLEDIEKYLNKICFFDRICLNIVIKKISKPGNVYIRLDKDVSVKLKLSKKIGIYIDYTFIESPTIYITSGYFLILENEAELAGSIVHELGHLSSLNDRIYLGITDEDYLKSEVAADRIAVFIIKEMGYKPKAPCELYERILLRYSDKIYWIQPKRFFVYRYLTLKKLAKEIYSSKEDQKKYKEYLYLSETQFKAKKEIVKYLQSRTKTSMVRDKKKRAENEPLFYFWGKNVRIKENLPGSETSTAAEQQKN